MVLDARRLAALVHREMVQLLLLMAVTVAVFAATRTLAGATRLAAARDAAELFRRGQAAMAAGRLDEAVGDFRRANARRRGYRPFVLELARALTAAGDPRAARRELLMLRDTSPEDSSDPDASVVGGCGPAAPLDTTPSPKARPHGTAPR